MEEDQLGMILGEYLTHLVKDEEYRVPIFTFATGANGSMSMGSYHEADDGSLELKVHGEHSEGPDYILPINILFIDGPTGRAARLLVRADKKPRLMLLPGGRA